MQTDLLVIGGGINGVGIAMDAAGRGLSVVLCEKDDLASHTSSASSKLIHGGLRYLEQMEFKLVKEALKEREILLFKAPHLIHPLEFVLPHDTHLRPSWMIRVGLFLYDHLSRRKKLRGVRHLKLQNVLEGFPLKEKFKRGFSYMDCQVDDARLVVANAQAAREKGAVILTRTTCQTAIRENGQWRVELYNQLAQQTEVIFAKAIVNAAGPWVSDVLQSVIKTDTASKIRLVKGSHITVPKLYEGKYAYIFQNKDGRVIFAIPYQNDFTLIGTTDVLFNSDPNCVEISEEEINYLLDSANYYLKKPIDRNQVIWSFAGTRALFDDQSKKAQLITRDYHIELNDCDAKAPVLSIFGGKLTTYRSLANKVIHKLKSYFPQIGEAWTETTPLPGGDLPNADFQLFQLEMKKKYPWLPEMTLSRYTNSYGTLMNQFLENSSSIQDLGFHFGADLYEKEVCYLIENEWAKTVEDVIWRRTKLGLRLLNQEIHQLQNFIECNVKQ